MMALGFVTVSVATAALLVGLGGDLAGDDRAPVSDDPTTKVARALLGPTPDEPMGDGSAGSMRAQDDAGATPLVAVTSLGISETHHGSVSQPESSSSRGPPGEATVRHVVPAASRPASTTLRLARSTRFALVVVHPSAVHAS
jgi:hypothetical protein